MPSTKHYSRCGLPLTLSCGHGVCYHCVVSKRHKNKNLNTTSHKTGPEYTSVCCKVCQHVSQIPHEAVKNVLAVVNCYQMGLTLMEDLEFEIAGENIGFQGYSHTLIKCFHIKTLMSGSRSLWRIVCSKKS